MEKRADRALTEGENQNRLSDDAGKTGQADDAKKTGQADDAGKAGRADEAGISGQTKDSGKAKQADSIGISGQTKEAGKADALTGKQRAVLRGLANRLDTVLQIGKDGLSEAVIRQTEEVLESRELVKARLLDNNLSHTARTAAQALAEATGSQVVQVIGSVFVLYRESRTLPPEQRIRLDGTRPASGLDKGRKVPEKAAKGRKAPAGPDRGRKATSGTDKGRKAPEKAAGKTAGKFGASRQAAKGRSVPEKAAKGQKAAKAQKTAKGRLTAGKVAEARTSKYWKPFRMERPDRSGKRFGGPGKDTPEKQSGKSVPEKRFSIGKGVTEKHTGKIGRTGKNVPEKRFSVGKSVPAKKRFGIGKSAPEKRVGAGKTGRSAAKNSLFTFAQKKHTGHKSRK